jgi:phage-related tail fiber protein
MKYQQPYGESDPDASYTNGDIGAGILGSIPPAAAIEHPQREIIAVIEAAGITPSEGDLEQLLAAIQALVAAAAAGATPAGTVSAFARNSAPSGWLKANGAAVLRASYPALDTAIYCGDGSNGTALFGYRCTNPASPSASRSTTGPYLVLPDLRGEFVRGWADGRAVDTGRAFGTAQSDALKDHEHDLYDDVNSKQYYAITDNNAPVSAPSVLGQGPTLADDASYFPGSGGVASPNGGATETRPRNVSLLYCIKT